MIRFDVDDVSQTGRATLGVHLIRMDDDAKVATMAKVEKQEDEDDNSDGHSQTPDDGSDQQSDTDEPQDNE